MTSSNDPDQIRAEIERTRSRLSTNVDTLAYEAKPSTMAKRQVGKVSGAVGGLRERVMGSAHDSTSALSDSAQSAVSSATEAAQSAPDRGAQAGARQPAGRGAHRLRCRAGGGRVDPGKREGTTGRGGGEGQGAATAAGSDRGSQGRGAELEGTRAAGCPSGEGHCDRCGQHRQSRKAPPPRKTYKTTPRTPNTPCRTTEAESPNSYGGEHPGRPPCEKPVPSYKNRSRVRDRREDDNCRSRRGPRGLETCTSHSGPVAVVYDCIVAGGRFSPDNELLQQRVRVR